MCHTLHTSMASTTQKTIWRTTNIPQDVHDDAALIASAERIAIGDLLAELLRPILRQRLAKSMSKRLGVDLKLKRQGATRIGGGK